VERTRQEVTREARSVVRHAQLDVAVVAAGFEADRAGTVAQGVVDEVGERLLEAEAVTVDPLPARGRDLERTSLPRGAAGVASGDGVEEVLGGDRRAAKWKAALIGPREDEQILGQPRQPVDLVGRRAESTLQVVGGARAPQGEVELGLKQGERRSELVA